MPSVYHPNTMSRQSLLNHLALIRADLNVLWTMARPIFKDYLELPSNSIDIAMWNIEQHYHIRSGATLYPDWAPGRGWY